MLGPQPKMGKRSLYLPEKKAQLLDYSRDRWTVSRTASHNLCQKITMWKNSQQYPWVCLARNELMHIIILTSPIEEHTAWLQRQASLHQTLYFFPPTVCSLRQAVRNTSTSATKPLLPEQQPQPHTDTQEMLYAVFKTVTEKFAKHNRRKLRTTYRFGILYLLNTGHCGLW